MYLIIMKKKQKKEKLIWFFIIKSRKLDQASSITILIFKNYKVKTNINKIKYKIWNDKLWKGVNKINTCMKIKINFSSEA